jgi:Lipopolysaccharide kinase (Kdo/WaaP) family
VPVSPCIDGFAVRARTLTRHIECDRDLPADLVKTLLRGDPNQLLARARLLQVKDRCTTARLDHPAGPLLIKRHEWGDWRRTARMLMRVPTSRASAAVGVRLVKQGIPTPRPRASIECGLGPFGYCSFLLTDFIEGTTLYRFVRNGSSSQGDLIHLGRQVAEIWQRLIDLGVSHNDLKPENFIVDPNLKVWLIDFERPRRHRGEAGLRQRHLADLVRFLHVRSWHMQPEAAEPFRRELLRTTLGRWLESSPLAGHPGLAEPFSAQQLAARLSVVIIAHDPVGPRLTANADPSVATAIDSVRDIADEILVARASSLDAWQVVQRIEEPGPIPSARPFQFSDRVAACKGGPKHPWVLVVRSDERVTPELARQIPEQIANFTNCDAFTIPVEERSDGHRAGSAHSLALPPVRLFQQERCSFSLRRGEILVFANPTRIGHLVDKLHRDRGAGADNTSFAAGNRYLHIASEILFRRQRRNAA